MSGNMYPVHKAFVDLETSATHTVGTDFYNNSAKGFKGFNDLETSATQTTSHESGFQYVGAAGVPLPQEETVGINDSFHKIITKIFDETLGIYEFSFLGKQGVDEYSPIYDEFNIIVYKTFDETLGIQETSEAVPFFDTPTAIYDEVHFTWYKRFDEVLGIQETERDVFIPIDFISTVKVEVSPAYNIYNTLDIETASIVKRDFCTNFSVYPYSLPPVTIIASDSANPFKPTVIIDDIVIISHNETEP